MKIDFAEEKYEMPHDLFEIRIENLGITDINVMQKESEWKIIKLSKEAKVVVARKDHAEKKNSALRKEVISTVSLLS